MFKEQFPQFTNAYDPEKMRSLVDLLQRKFQREVQYQPGVASAATYSMPRDVDFVLVTRTATGASAVTIPLATDRPNQMIVIKDSGQNASANNITITGSASNQIDGANTLVLSSDGEAARLRSDGVTWYRI